MKDINQLLLGRVVNADLLGMRLMVKRLVVSESIREVNQLHIFLFIVTKSHIIAPHDIA